MFLCVPHLNEEAACMGKSGETQPSIDTSFSFKKSLTIQAQLFERNALHSFRICERPSFTAYAEQ